MDTRDKNKWQVRLAALLIFLLGATAGALAPRAYHGWHRSGVAHEPEDFDQMLARLQLSDAQQTQVRQILSDTRGQLEALRRESEPKVAQIRQQTDERLQQVLTPAQWQQFQQMREAARARHRHHDGHDQHAPASTNNSAP